MGLKFQKVPNKWSNFD